jgi:hypothetical protein
MGSVADNVVMTFTSLHSTNEKLIGPHGRAACAIIESGPSPITGTSMVHLACPLK